MRVALDLPSLLEALQEYRFRETKSGPAWSPITWECDERAAENAESVCALVYDLDWDERLDHDRALGALGERLQALSWVYVIHETFTARRWRLVLPLSRDLAPGEYGRTWELVRSTLALEADPTGRDLARLFYLPSHTPGETREAGAGGEALLDPDALPGFPVSPKNLEPKISGGKIQNSREISSPKNLVSGLDLEKLREQVSRSPKGENRRDLLDALDFKLTLRKGHRENRLHALVCAFVNSCEEGSDWRVVEEIFRPVVERMEQVEDHGPAHYMERVNSSWLRASETKARRDAHQAAAKGYFATFQEDWRKGLKCQVDKDGNPTKVKALSSNIDLILEHHEAFRGFIHFNELMRRMEISGGPLLRCDGSYDVGLMQWLETSEFSMEADKSLCGSTLLHHSRKHRYNPVRDYLETLVWDGKQRLRSLLRDYCNAEGNADYIDSVSQKFFIGAVARALDPGCKLDTVLVLAGAQGTRKTTFVQTLSKGWYTTANSRVDDKDMRIQTTESWLVEMSELATVSRQSIEQLRGFITAQKDRIRIPYATYHEDFPRRCAFIGTTNDSQPLIDEEGNRRWWVVSCGRIDAVRLAEDADQLWAEAVHYFRAWQEEMKAGRLESEQQYRWWFTPEEQELSDEENEVYQKENPLESDIHEWWSKAQREGKDLSEGLSTMQVAKNIRLTNETLHRDPTIAQRVGKALTHLGWTKKRKGAGKARFWVYIPPGHLRDDSETVMQ